MAEVRRAVWPKTAIWYSKLTYLFNEVRNWCIHASVGHCCGDQDIPDGVLGYSFCGINSFQFNEFL